MSTGKRITLKKMVVSARKDPVFNKEWNRRRLQRMLGNLLFSERFRREITMEEVLRKTSRLPRDANTLESCAESAEALEALEQYASAVGCTIELRILDKKTHDEIAAFPCDPKRLKRLEGKK